MKKTVLLLLALSLIVIMTSCQKAEKVVISKYFQAMKHDDRDTMSAMSAEPKDLEFTSFEVVSIGEPVIGDAELQNFIKQLDGIKKQMKEQAMKAGDFRDEVLDLEDELEDTRRASKKRELKKKIEDAKKNQEEAEKKYKDLLLERNKTKKKIQVEKNYITLSIGQRENIEEYTGKTYTSKTVVSVTLTDDKVVDYEFLLRRYEFLQNEKVIPNRLSIIKIQALEKQ